MRTSEALRRDKVRDLTALKPKRFFICDLHHKHTVFLESNFNKESKRSYVSRLVIDDKEVYVDRDELMMALQTD